MSLSARTPKRGKAILVGTMATPSSSLRGATGAFRAVAYLEALTYLLLLTAVVVYRVFDGPDFISTLGPIHGIAFLVYVALVLRIRESQGWGLWWTLGIIVLAAVPFGGFWAGNHLRQETPAVASA